MIAAAVTEGAQYWRQYGWEEHLPQDVMFEASAKRQSTSALCTVSFQIDLSQINLPQGAPDGAALTIRLLAAWQIVLWFLRHRRPFTTFARLDGVWNSGNRELLPVICDLRPEHSVADGVAELETRVADHARFAEYFAAPSTLGPSAILFDVIQAPRRAGVTRSDFRIKCVCVVSEGSVLGELTVDAAALPLQDVETLSQQFQAAFASITRNPASRIGNLDVGTRVSPSRQSAKGPREPATVVRRIVAQCTATPERLAVVAPDGQLTYQQLHDIARRIASSLKKKGVGEDELVGLLVPTSIYSVAAWLGIWLAGGAVAPIDPESPPDYVARMIERSRIRFVMASGPASGIPPERLIDTRECLVNSSGDLWSSDSGLSPLSLAYGVHTSGSSGRPKCVGVSHGALVSYVDAITERFGWTPANPLRFALCSSMAADLGFTCVMPALSLGDTLHLPDRKSWTSPESLGEYLQSHAIDVLKIVPAHLRGLLSFGPDVLPARYLVVGGERFTADLRDALAAMNPRCAVINHYGPTETTVGCLSDQVFPDEQSPTQHVLCVGYPLANSVAFVLDDELRPLATNVPGELFVAGEGVARGYLNQPDLTAERFLPNPFASEPGQRLYRTGDLARVRPDGRVQVLGRCDTQIKVRGVRIEPGEIEAMLRAEPGVRAIAVVQQESRGTLVAYVCRDRAAPCSETVLREAASRQLPSAMAPGAYVFVDELPLLPSGKIDRKGLSKRSLPEAKPVAVAAKPGSLVQTVMDIWRTVLSRQSVDADSDFFSLGGDSISAIQIAASLRKAGWKMAPLDVFRHPTPEKLAASLVAVGTAPGAASGSAQKTMVEQTFPLTPIQQGILFDCLVATNDRMYVSQLVLRFDLSFDVGALGKAWAAVVDRHSIFRTSFHWSDDGVPYQRVSPNGKLRIEHLDWSALDARELEARQKGYCANEARALRLDTAPLIRVAVARLADGSYRSVWTYHHLLMDGWSDTILYEELARYYDSIRKGRDLTLERPLPYHRYVEWLTERDAGKDLQFWRQYLQGYIPGSGAVPGSSAERDFTQVHISASDAEQLRELAKRLGITLGTLIQGAWALVLRVTTGVEDVVFGATVAIRPVEIPELSRSIGPFLNTIPIRTRFPDDSSIGDWLHDLQREQAQSREYGACSLTDIRKSCGIAADARLFESILSVQNFGSLAGSSVGFFSNAIPVNGFEFAGGWTSYPLSVEVEPREGLVIGASFDPRLMTIDGCRDLLNLFAEILQGPLHAPDQRVGAAIAPLVQTWRRRANEDLQSRIAAQRARLRPSTHSGL